VVELIAVRYKRPLDNPRRRWEAVTHTKNRNRIRETATDAASEAKEAKLRRVPFFSFFAELGEQPKGRRRRSGGGGDFTKARY
jgi:hypothetical protein